VLSNPAMLCFQTTSVRLPIWFWYCRNVPKLLRRMSLVAGRYVKRVG
jgi:hypothetical protein